MQYAIEYDTFKTNYEEITNVHDQDQIKELFNFYNGNIEQAISAFTCSEYNPNTKQNSKESNPIISQDVPITHSSGTTEKFPIHAEAKIEKPLEEKKAPPSVSELATLTSWEVYDANKIYKYMQEQKTTNPSYTCKEFCSICLNDLYEESILKLQSTVNAAHSEASTLNKNQVVRLSKCKGHFFHKECVYNHYISQHSKHYYQCSICKELYGILIGNQPEGGRMTHAILQHKQCPLEGYNKEDTIMITYDFPNCAVNKIKYTGFTRSAYLPMTKEGYKVLQLLYISFNRRLTFTIGTSLTTGEENQIIWNGVHHKTSTFGGFENFGYPDDSYFKRVTEELLYKGVTLNTKYTSYVERVKQIILPHCLLSFYHYSLL